MHLMEQQLSKGSAPYQIETRSSNFLLNAGRTTPINYHHTWLRYLGWRSASQGPAVTAAAGLRPRPGFETAAAGLRPRPVFAEADGGCMIYTDSSNMHPGNPSLDDLQSCIGEKLMMRAHA